MRIVVVGAGVFGLSTALAMRRRGHEVVLLEAGRLPSPFDPEESLLAKGGAGAWDLNRLVRPDYGADGDYADLMLAALDRWKLWASTMAPLFHRTGMLAVCQKAAFKPGGFEYDSRNVLATKGVAVTLLDDEDAIRSRCPAMTPPAGSCGYWNDTAGWGEAGHTIGWLARQARKEGVILRQCCAVTALLSEAAAAEAEAALSGTRDVRCTHPSSWLPAAGAVSSGHSTAGGKHGSDDAARVVAVKLADGTVVRGDAILVSAGAWTPELVEETADVLHSTGQPCFYLRPQGSHAAEFEEERYPPIIADITRTGYYGFPLTSSGLLKWGRHGPGIRRRPGESRDVTDEQRRHFRAFLADWFPSLLRAEVVAEKLCMYCDSWDSHFYIDWVPGRPGLAIAAGGSGHAFKFVPVLGDVVADMLERRDTRFTRKFAWRTRAVAGDGSADRSGDSIRCVEPEDTAADGTVAGVPAAAAGGKHVLLAKALSAGFSWRSKL